MQRSIIAVVLMGLASACSSTDGTEGAGGGTGIAGQAGAGGVLPSTTPGAFALARFDGLRDGTPEPNAVTFDLGDLKASRDFYFLLRNVGGAAVTNITLTSSDAAFPVSPNTISSLDPEATASTLPIIRVTAVHGTAIGGVGWMPVLAAGPHEWTINIAGETVDAEGGVSPVTFTAQLKARALLMDIEAWDGTQEIDLAHAPSMAGDEPNFWLQTAIPRIKNTGNVPITIRSLANPPTMPSLHEATLQPGSESTEQDIASWCSGNCFHFEIDGQNTVADASRLPVDSDGKIRFYAMPQ